MALRPKHHNIEKWIEENKGSFLPPICNKMMHGETQMKCFFVGGPNIRKDYHLEEGPEFFYMVKGDMCLKIVEQNKHKDVIIRQGQVFMLPSRIQHSPQRKADTVGLVIERERLPHETDGLRYFVEEDGVPTSELLYESWFHCQNLGPQLAAIINKYFETEQYKTGKPLPGTIKSYEEAPVRVDINTTVNDPFDLEKWLDDNAGTIEVEGSLDLFGAVVNGATVKVYGPGEVTLTVPEAEVFIWSLRGGCTVKAADEDYKVESNESLWLPNNTCFTLSVTDKNARVLVLYMEPPKA